MFISFHFLLVATYRLSNTEKDKFYHVVPVAIKIGKELVKKYLSKTKQEYSLDKDDYTTFFDYWKERNPHYNYILDDSFYLSLGIKLIEILTDGGVSMLKQDLKVVSMKQKYQILSVVDEEIFSNDKRSFIMSLPTKLPMIAKPKEYSSSELGGYFLNNVKFRDSLIIKKNAYSFCSTLSESNEVINMINGINSTPFFFHKYHYVRLFIRK